MCPAQQFQRQFQGGSVALEPRRQRPRIRRAQRGWRQPGWRLLIATKLPEEPLQAYWGRGVNRCPPEPAERAAPVAARGQRLAPGGERSPRTHQAAQKGAAKVGVTAEKFIGALAIQHNLDVRLGRQLEDAPLRIDARAGKRLVLMPNYSDELGEQILQRRKHIM